MSGSGRSPFRISRSCWRPSHVSGSILEDLPDARCDDYMLHVTVHVIVFF